MTLRGCSVCGSREPAARELCGRCGADLDHQHPVAWPRAVNPDVPTVASERRIQSAGGWWPLAMVAIMSVVVIAGLFASGVGPFSRATTPPPPAALDGEIYAEPRVLLELTDIATVTMSPPEGDREFSPVQMVDDDPATAWRSQPYRDGEREIVDLYLAEPSWVEMLLVRNGDHLEADAYASADRVHRALVTFDGGVRFIVDLLDIGRIPQAIELPAPILTTTVRIEIVEVFRGSGEVGTAISDLELRGRIAVDDDVDEVLARAEAWPANAPTRAPAGVLDVLPSN